MTTTIIESQAFDIAVTESPNHKGVPCYIVRYGLEVKKRDTVEDAMKEFKECLDHALTCKGVI